MQGNWFFRGMSVFLLFVMMTACSDKTETNNTEEQQENIEGEEQEQVEMEPSEDLRKEDYEKIVVGDYDTGEGGSTREEVIALFGFPDTVQGSEIAEGSENSREVTYEWYRQGGRRATVKFKNDRVNGKSWFNNTEEIEEIVNEILNK